MKKSIGILLTIGMSIYIGMTQITESYADEIATVTTNDLNVRKGPSVKYSILAKANKNEKVTLLKSSNGWSQVRLTTGKDGWVNTKFLNVAKEETNNTPKPEAPTTTQSKQQKIVAVAKQQIGKPYVWGATGPNSFDCSGLTSYAYKHGANHKLPRTSTEQSRVGKSVSKSDLKPGDLIFFGSSSKNINHVGLYIGDSKMVHSPKPGDKVRTENINSSYYAKRFVSAKRILN